MTTEISRLVRPAALLHRLRPLRLATPAAELQNAARLYTALKLLRQLFPQEMAEEIGNAALRPGQWHQMLGLLCSLVEQHRWLPINWEALNEAWAAWMQADGDDNGDQLAAYLHYIPVAMYGFSEGEKIFEFPPLELLRALLDPHVEAVSSSLLIEAELYDALDHEWNDPMRQAAWQRLEQIERDPGRYPEPVRFLPELARWACSRTGNPLLDRAFNPYQAGPWFTWAEDLARIRRLWRQASPVVAMFHRLMAWYERDSSNLAKLTHFFFNGGNTDEFDW